MSNSTSKKDQWRPLVAKFQRPNLAKAIWQLSSTLAAYAGVWALIYFALQVSVWLTIPLALLASLLLIRIFIFHHDCGHGSFFKSKKANDFWGFITGVLTFTPYYHWRWEHAIHHSTNGDLDRRGVGDIWTLTVQEYLESSRWKKFAYRLARNPIVLFVIAPLVVFTFWHRMPRKDAPRRERNSVWWTNLGLLVYFAGLSSIFGVWAAIALQVSIMTCAGCFGVWLFYVQHQYEGAYWERGDDWDYTDAAMKGSSFYKLPKILQWFSGNIGFHHLHHLSPRIPNYNLEKCHKSDPFFDSVNKITAISSLKSMNFHLWDEASRKLISFRQMRKLRKSGHQFEKFEKQEA